MLKISQETCTHKKMCIQSNQIIFMNKHLEKDYKEIKAKKQVFSEKPNISERIFLIQNNEMVMEGGTHFF